MINPDELRVLMSTYIQEANESEDKPLTNKELARLRDFMLYVQTLTEEVPPQYGNQTEG